MTHAYAKPSPRRAGGKRRTRALLGRLARALARARHRCLVVLGYVSVGDWVVGLARAKKMETQPAVHRQERPCGRRLGGVALCASVYLCVHAGVRAGAPPRACVGFCLVRGEGKLEKAYSLRSYELAVKRIRHSQLDDVLSQHAASRTNCACLWHKQTHDALCPLWQP